MFVHVLLICYSLHIILVFHFCVLVMSNIALHYLQLVGFFGGIHLAVLSAFICQKHPTASLSTLVSIFFKTFAFWPCPTPVVLHDGLTRPFIPSEKLGFLPIQLPGSECDFCHSNITRSTFQKIRTEFLRGHVLTKV